MKQLSTLAAGALLALGAAAAWADTDILFIGNSFTFGWGSPVRFYRSATVTDLNNEGIGGMPALFKSFVDQAGLDYDVFLETRGGSGLDFHLESKRGVIGRRGWDAVVMHGYSTLDRDNPRDPALLVETSREMADFLRLRNDDVELYLLATWPRPDQVYRPEGAWAGEPLEAMARDLRAAYDMSAEAGRFAAVIPVGEAFSRAVQADVADANPYDGIDRDRVNLWSYDDYHGSAYGYYLEALVVFGAVTGRDPRSLGENECSGYELGFSRAQVSALQRVAFDELAKAGAARPSPLVLPESVNPERCVDPR